MISQGCKYSYGPYPCIAMEHSTGPTARIAIIDHQQPYPLRPAQYVESARLKPMGMKYHDGQTPSGEPE